MEVLENRAPNSGRDVAPNLLKRGRLPKNLTKSLTNVATIGAVDAKKLDHYTPSDFRIGKFVNVFGRDLLICDCDKFTQDYYVQTFGLSPEDFQPLQMQDPIAPLPKMPIAPYNGYGTEEDSLNSCKYLIPKPPVKNFQKLMQYDGKNLRFVCKLANGNKLDSERLFTLTYYMVDDTISIFEKIDRNSGFVAGKFLERTRVKNSQTQEYVKPSDTFVGAILHVNYFQFQLVEADEFTFKFMEENPHLFPKANLSDIQKRLAGTGLNASSANTLLTRFKQIDSSATGTVERSAFRSLLSEYGFVVDEQESITLARKFGGNKESIKYLDFLAWF